MCTLVRTVMYSTMWEPRVAPTTQDAIDQHHAPCPTMMETAVSIAASLWLHSSSSSSLKNISVTAAKAAVSNVQATGSVLHCASLELSLTRITGDLLCRRIKIVLDLGAAPVQGNDV